MKLLKNCRILNKDEFQNLDILIKDDTIVKVGDIEANSNYQVIDAEYNYVLPGFLDFHVHLEDKINGFNIKDTYESGTKNALLNGITTIMSFITQGKNETLHQAIDRVHSKAKNNLWIDVGWHLTPTKFDEKAYGEIQETIDDGACSFKFYTTYKEAGIYSNYDEIERFARSFSKDNILMMVHCEDDESIKVKESQFNNVTIDNLAKVRTKIVEMKAVKRIMKIAKRTNSFFHIAHVSSKEAVDIINNLKYKDLVTCETCPQYIYLDNSVYTSIDKHQYLCYPPLRDKANNMFLADDLRFGKISIVASDHCPFTIEDKNINKNSVYKSPGGLLGLDYLPYLVSNMVDRHEDKVRFLNYKLCENPARLAGLFPEKGVIAEGSLADLVVINFDDEHELSSRDGIFNPYKGITSNLNIKKVLKSGKLVVENNKLVSNKLNGAIL